MIKPRIALCLLATGLMQPTLHAANLYISPVGKDTQQGTQSAPFLTISKAAETAQPGDTVWVHAGTYRERVTPACGGTGNDQRITYRNVPGEEVFIKGSEQITNWVQEEGSVWKVTLPNSFFGNYNPYALHTDGSALQYGAWHHRGDVYLNDEAYYEKQTLKEVTQCAKRWHAKVDEQSTTLWANFGGTDPNAQLAEINVRETLFWPAKAGINFITVNGFHLSQAAPNWAGHMEPTQMAAIGPMMSKGWIIENCTVTHSRSVGIGLGQAPNVNVQDIEAFGNHIVRNNIIRKCGQSGIAGKRGGTRCQIYGNLIEDTNYRREFGGDETAAIKLMRSVDAVIRDNLIRRVFQLDDRAAFGIWIDYCNQGTRITRNIIYGTDTQTIFLEMNHGPILVDHNVLIGPQGVSNISESSVFAHNLFVDCSFYYNTDTRQSGYYTPHTTIQHEKQPMIQRDDKLLNNLFIENGFNNIESRPRYESDFNAFVQGAQKSTFDDAHSVVDPFDTNFRTQEKPLGVTFTFLANAALAELDVPVVDANRLGVFETSGQSLEDRTGAPITLATDFNGRSYSPPKAGPLANLKEGINTLRWTYSTDRR